MLELGYKLAGWSQGQVTGDVLNTNNLLTYIDSFSKYPNKQVFVFPQIEDICRLYSLHKALIKKYYSNDEPILP
jgi:hypothetical protein